MRPRLVRVENVVSLLKSQPGLSLAQIATNLGVPRRHVARAVDEARMLGLVMALREQRIGKMWILRFYCSDRRKIKTDMSREDLLTILGAGTPKRFKVAISGLIAAGKITHTHGVYKNVS